VAGAPAANGRQGIGVLKPKGLKMKKIVLSAIAAAVLSATSAFAADMPVKAKAPPPPPSPWDWAFGGALLTDYNFRGISQSNRGPSGTVYSETRYNVNTDWQLYAGQQYWAVTLPTNPTCECDLYGGIRPTFGSLSLDLGAIYYWYPREKQHLGFPNPILGATFPQYPNGNTTLKQTDFWEVYLKGTWEVVKDRFWLGFNEYYSPSWLNTGAYGNFASGTAKVGLPSFKLGLFGMDEIGWYLSGEVGYYAFGTTNFVPGVFVGPIAGTGVKMPNYTFWNAGAAFTWKVATLDLRAYGTDLTKANCNILTGDPTAAPNAAGVLGSKWCGTTFIGAMKFDLTAMANLK
jgi:Bacterial protein of unknown function (Gcw_chp)